MIRKANLYEIDEILEIYERARNFMRESGNPNQWKSAYPSKDIVTSDILAGNLYVLTDAEHIDGVFMFAKGPDATYTVIDGAWNNDNDYYVIHRVASAGTRKGILFDIFHFALEYSNDIRIDTHEDNKPMQHQLEKAGFIKCGTIILAGGDPRIAYHYTRG